MHTAILTLFLALTCMLYSDVKPNSLDRQVKTLEYKFANQEQELAFVKEGLASLQTIIEAEQQDVSRLVTQAKESIKKTVSSSDTQLQAIEKNIEKLASDLKAFKKQANDIAQTIVEIQKHTKEKDETIAMQASSIKELENAMRLLASAMQTKSESTSSKVYEVKNGDTLDKIAKECHITTSAIKQENNMQSDKIYPGQKLQIP